MPFTIRFDLAEGNEWRTFTRQAAEELGLRVLIDRDDPRHFDVICEAREEAFNLGVRTAALKRKAEEAFAAYTEGLNKR